MKPITVWLSAEQLNDIYTAQYWNDIEIEKTKAWWIDSPKDPGVRNYLRDSGLISEFETCLPILEQVSESLAPSQLVVLDLAAGTGWASALLSKLSFVSEVHSVEISEHRLGALFETTVASLSGDPNKIARYLGSFYDVQLSDSSVDVAFLSQAFHHSDQPELLLAEIQRVLKQDGLLLMIGEHNLNWASHLRRLAALIVRQRRVPRSWLELYPPDPELGDHYYSRRQYRRMLAAFGFQAHFDTSANSLVIWAKKSSGSS